VNKEMTLVWKEQTENFLKAHRQRQVSDVTSNSVSPISSRRPSYDDKPSLFGGRGRSPSIGIVTEKPKIVEVFKPVLKAPSPIA